MNGIWVFNFPTGAVNYKDRFQVATGISPSFATEGTDIDVPLDVSTIVSSVLVPFIYLPGRKVRVKLRMAETIKQRIRIRNG